MTVTQQCKCTLRPLNCILKAVKMINYMLCIFYHCKSYLFKNVSKHNKCLLKVSNNTEVHKIKRESLALHSHSPKDSVSLKEDLNLFYGISPNFISKEHRRCVGSASKN